MIEVRAGPTVTLLLDGRVLVAGGQDISGDGGPLASAELYDPGSGSWAPTGNMIEARNGHTATLLLDGTVLVVGGSDSTGGTVASAELYDPDSGSWTATDSMISQHFGLLIEGRAGHTATLLPDGRVLVVGGSSVSISGAGTVTSAELYDPGSGSWAPTGNMIEDRAGHTAALLPDGRVLVVGGYSVSITASTADHPVPVASAELYDPGSGSWTATASMIEVRSGHTATLLPDGRVLVAGGSIGDDVALLASAELYDPGSGSWTPTGNMIEARYGDTATLLPDGRVLVAGGSGGGGLLASAELYDPGSGSWAPTGNMIEDRAGHAATLLLNGTVLVAGGNSLRAGCVPAVQACSLDGLASAELYDPGSGT